MPHSTFSLSKRQHQKLLTLYKSGKGKPALRAQYLLLLDKGYLFKEVADFCFCHHETVSDVLERYLSHGFDGLFDQERSGAPTKLAPEDERFLYASLFKCPFEIGYFTSNWTIDLMCYHLESKRGKKISRSSLKELLYKRGWSFKRPKHIPSVKNPLEESEQLELLRLLENPKENEVVLFGDETDLETLSKIYGAWMLKGTQTKVRSPKKNEVLCCFGFFNPHDKEFYYKLVKGREKKNGSNFVWVLHQLRRNYKGKVIHIWLDNASYHNSKTKLLKAFREKYGEEVKVHFLPVKSPQLNPIERFWKFVKGKVSGNWLYENLRELELAFKSVIHRYRATPDSYRFQIKNLASIWKRWPTVSAA